jgi:hypothetical protein
VKEVANQMNPVVRGWIEYYGAFFQSELLFMMHHLDKLLYRWVVRKYKKQGSNFKKADNWVKRLKSAEPNFFCSLEFALLLYPRIGAGFGLLYIYHCRTGVKTIETFLNGLNVGLQNVGFIRDFDFLKTTIEK